MEESESTRTNKEKKITKKSQRSRIVFKEKNTCKQQAKVNKKIKEMGENVNINIRENKVVEKVTVMTKKAREDNVGMIYITKEAFVPEQSS